MGPFYVPSESGWQESHGNGQYVRFEVNQTYDSAQNKSTLSITLQYKGSTGDRIITGLDPYAKVSSTSLFSPISGKLFYPTNSTEWFDLVTNDYDPISPASYTVTHNADGTASVAFSIKFRIGADWSWENSATLSLTNTPSYTLTISQGTGSSITVKRSGVTLSNGATIYRNDVLTITFAANSGYVLATHTVNGTTFTSGNTHTVTGNVTVVATATAVGVYIDTGSGFELYQVYIDNGSSWEVYAPYIDNGSSWEVY